MSEFKVHEETIEAAKIAMRKKGFSYTGKAPGTTALHPTLSPTIVCAFINGRARLTTTDSDSILSALGLSMDQKAEYARFPVRSFTQLPNDPLIYRFIEVLANYGPCIREISNELFATPDIDATFGTGRGGDGIMSAITFSMHVLRRNGAVGETLQTLPGPGSDTYSLQGIDAASPRLTVIMDGKWLNYLTWKK